MSKKVVYIELSVFVAIYMVGLQLLINSNYLQRPIACEYYVLINLIHLLLLAIDILSFCYRMDVDSPLPVKRLVPSVADEKENQRFISLYYMIIIHL